MDEAIEHFRLFMRLQTTIDPARLDETVEQTIRKIAAEQGSEIIRQST